MALRGQTPLSRVIEAAEEAAIVIEMVGGVGSWEIMPGMKHSRITKAIDRSTRRNAIAESDCGCYSYQDVYIRFTDGSYKRPDIAIF